MKCAKFVMYAFVVCGLWAASALSQEAVMELNSKALGSHERPIVQFTHEQHSKIILECLRCHHNYDQYGNNTSSEGQSCSECHAKTAGENPLALQEAFHAQCKRCHEQTLAKGTASGPVMCGECHRKK